MEAPKCKQCGKRHWERICVTAFSIAPDFKISVAPADPKVDVTKLPLVKFDRNAYQRDLMRKRRAAAKAKKAP